ncbi:hypothetical protein MMC20_007776 [Loxospora ochrophaea]|nr:hypothetical protein [Loxospora ochrophaea]
MADMLCSMADAVSDADGDPLSIFDGPLCSPSALALTRREFTPSLSSEAPTPFRDASPAPGKLPTIPLEILQQILRDLFLADGPIDVGPIVLTDRVPGKYVFGGHGDRTSLYFFKDGEKRKEPHKETTAVFLACRKLYEVAMPLFYSNNEFMFNSPSSYDYLVKFLEGIGPRRRRFIGRICIVDEDDRGYSPRSRATLGYRLLGQSCHLRSLELRIKEFELAKRHLDPPNLQPKVCWGKYNPAHKTAEWVQYYHIRDLNKYLPGLKELREFRGLKEVTLWNAHTRHVQDRTGKEFEGSLFAENRPFESELVQLMTSPKFLLDGEDERDVPARRRTRDLQAKKRELEDESGDSKKRRRRPQPKQPGADDEKEKTKRTWWDSEEYQWGEPVTFTKDNGRKRKRE